MSDAATMPRPPCSEACGGACMHVLAQHLEALTTCRRWCQLMPSWRLQLCTHANDHRNHHSAAVCSATTPLPPNARAWGLLKSSQYIAGPGADASRDSSASRGRAY